MEMFSAAYSAAAPLFSFPFLSFQVFQLFFNFFAELHLAFQEATGPARDTIRLKFYTVFSIEIKIFTGKGHVIIVCKLF